MNMLHQWQAWFSTWLKSNELAVACAWWRLVLLSPLIIISCVMLIGAVLSPPIPVSFQTPGKWQYRALGGWGADISLYEEIAPRESIRVPAVGHKPEIGWTFDRQGDRGFIIWGRSVYWAGATAQPSFQLRILFWPLWFVGLLLAIPFAVPFTRSIFASVRRMDDVRM